jgi:2-dehydro-3-deoxygluconokinase
MSMLDIVSAGEVMVEFAGSANSNAWQQNFGGDSFNTAVYLARAGLSVGYMTRLGDDGFSNKVLGILRDEHIHLDYVDVIANRQMGLYTIHNSANGERSFSYWRGQSPAREMFDQPAKIPACRHFYFSGISLAIIAKTGLNHCIAFLQELKQRNVRIIFDPNYRPKLWSSPEETQRVYKAALALCDLVLPTFDDEQALWGFKDLDECRAFYQQFPISELVIKAPDLSCHVFIDDQHIVKATTPVKALDTTGAGDSFNAGYLAARLRNQAVETAIADAQALSAQVVQCRGAILPRA